MTNSFYKAIEVRTTPDWCWSSYRWVMSPARCRCATAVSDRSVLCPARQSVSRKPTKCNFTAWWFWSNDLQVMSLALCHTELRRYQIAPFYVQLDNRFLESRQSVILPPTGFDPVTSQVMSLALCRWAKGGTICCLTSLKLWRVASVKQPKCNNTGGWVRTNGLGVMSPARYPCATPVRGFSLMFYVQLELWRAASVKLPKCRIPPRGRIPAIRFDRMSSGLWAQRATPAPRRYNMLMFNVAWAMTGRFCKAAELKRLPPVGVDPTLAF